MTDGNGFTDTLIELELSDKQPLLIACAVYTPLWLTIIFWSVIPLDHNIFDELEFKEIEFPWQNSMFPFDVIVGGVGLLLTVILVGKDVAEHVPLLTFK